MSELQELAYRSIRRGLLEGSIRSPRDLSQRKLAAALKVDPNSVRCALVRLEAEKVLTRQPQSGTFVRRLDADEFRRLYDIRALMEPYAAGRAAQFINREQLGRLAAACRGMSGLLDDLRRCGPDEWPTEYSARILRLEHEFHGTILEAAQAPEAAHIVENFRVLMHVCSFTEQWPRPALLAAIGATVKEHRAIFHALRKGDVSRSRARMLRHLRTGFMDEAWTLEDSRK